MIMKKILMNKLWNNKIFDRKGKCFFYYYRTMTESDIRRELNKLGG